MPEKLLIAARVPGRWFVIWFVAFAMGCASTTEQSIQTSPLDSERQQQAVLDITPLGTARADVERDLKAAGMELSPGTSPSICYCTLWNRANGERWHMDVALLFDETGKLYATRRAQSETTIDRSDEGTTRSTSKRDGRDATELEDRTSPFSSSRSSAAPGDSSFQSPFTKSSSSR